MSVHEQQAAQWRLDALCNWRLTQDEAFTFLHTILPWLTKANTKLWPRHCTARYFTTSHTLHEVTTTSSWYNHNRIYLKLFMCASRMSQPQCHHPNAHILYLVYGFISKGCSCELVNLYIISFMDSSYQCTLLQLNMPWHSELGKMTKYVAWSLKKYCIISGATNGVLCL